jgi:hypothetical protein
MNVRTSEKFPGEVFHDEEFYAKKSYCLKKREFLGEEFYKWALQDNEEMLRFRNEVSARRPTDEEKTLLKLYKPWFAFYKAILKD